MFNLITNWLKTLTAKRIDTIYLMRKDRLTTGYVSYVFVDNCFVCYALDTYDLTANYLVLAKGAIVTDEFTEPHYDHTLVLAPGNTLYEKLSRTVTVNIDSNHMAIEC